MITPLFLMHAPDGFFSTPVAAVFWAVTAIVIAYSVRQTSAKLDDRAIPLMGMMAAFIFAAQMFNFQVPGGTSGHLLGGVLAAILLGPWAGTIVMACVIAVQALVFQDGGLVVMGANIFNMGVIGTLGGFALYRALVGMFGGEERGRLIAAAIAGWASVFVASVIVAGELAISDTASFGVALAAMAGWHAVIGIGEGLITVAALAFIANSRPDLLKIRESMAAEAA